MLVFSLLYSSLTHRTLHSFPTRRSSDLANVAKKRLIAVGCVEEGEVVASERLSTVGRVESSEIVGSERLKTSGRVPVGFVRSEEHTSELQSRFDLVCRLLLEKKKKNINS